MFLPRLFPVPDSFRAGPASANAAFLLPGTRVANDDSQYSRRQVAGREPEGRNRRPAGFPGRELQRLRHREAV